MFKRFITLIGISLLALPLLAQDAPLTFTDGQAGPIRMTYPDTWQLLPAPNGVVILTNFQNDDIGEAESLPDDAIVGQLQLLGLPRVAGLSAEEQSAFNILGGLIASQLAEGEAPPPIGEVSRPTYTFARADIGTESTDAIAYAVILSDATFGIFTFSSQQGGLLAEQEATILTMLDTIELVVDVAFTEDVQVRYDAYAQGVTDAGFPRLGRADAPVTVEVITSFDCPACRTFHETVLPTLLPRINAGDVQVVTVPIYGTGSYPNGDTAARAALCVGGDAFWGYSDTLFSWQEQYSGFAYMYERLQQAAQGLVDLAPDAFNDCFVSAQTTQTLQNAIDVAVAQLGTQVATPSVIVNGAQVPADSQSINAVIDNVLAGQE